MTIYATAPRTTAHTNAGARTPKRTAFSKLRMEAPTLVDFGLDGIQRWAHKNHLRSATIEYNNNTKFTGTWLYRPASPGHRESLALINAAENIEAIALSGVWVDTNGIRPQISAIVGHK